MNYEELTTMLDGQREVLEWLQSHGASEEMLREQESSVALLEMEVEAFTVPEETIWSADTVYSRRMDLGDYIYHARLDDRLCA